MNKRVLFSLLFLGLFITAVVKATSSFFSDTETSSGNIFQAGAFDLLINGENNPEAIVDIGDLKPGDEYFIDKTLTIQNPAMVWVHLIEFESSPGIETEPERVEEDGTPKHDLENYLTYDLSVRDEVLISFNDEVLFPDIFSCWIPLGEFESGDTTVTQSFHFDEDVTNWAQGDTLTFSEEFYAEQSRNNPNASPPESDRVWSNKLKKCIYDLDNRYTIEYTCTSVCSGVYPHTMNITNKDLVTGNFSGNGFYNPNNAYTWDFTGNSIGTSINYFLTYTGLNPGYTVTATGTISPSGDITGTAFSSTGQTFDFVMY